MNIPLSTRTIAVTTARTAIGHMIGPPLEKSSINMFVSLLVFLLYGRLPALRVSTPFAAVALQIILRIKSLDLLI
ncbi:hypothetical protein [Methylacidimicrobium tartarophylax]|uniref:hypothetical protein n=1 Tax=Methylacidimicrobium tartarophylax TaxID=1041768 RepID=UPI0015B53318|nr:hypothetical protein [Methylacidimicrobium tartarophylax]